jgi:hypothetical protein
LIFSAKTGMNSSIQLNNSHSAGNSGDGRVAVFDARRLNETVTQPNDHQVLHTCSRSNTRS